MSESKQSVEPSPGSQPSFEQSVEAFHRVDHRGSLGEMVVTDERDPFVWLPTQIGEGGYRGGASAALKRLMWAAYRLVGTLPSEDSLPKLRDQDPMNFEIEAELLSSLSEGEKDLLARYHDHLYRTELKLSSSDETSLDVSSPSTLELNSGVDARRMTPGVDNDDLY